MQERLQQEESAGDVTAAGSAPGDDKATPERPPAASSEDMQEEDAQLVRDTRRAPQKLVEDVAIAELSTGDELLTSASPAEATGDESLDEAVDEFLEPAVVVDAVDESLAPVVVVDACEDCNSFPAEELPQLLFTQLYQPVGQFQMPVPYNDAWLTPLDEIIRSPEEARQVYEQLYQDMCRAAEPVPEGHYQAVLCDDAQKLYTDGQQLYMLACIDMSDSTDPSAPRLMRPVVDACDPLHEEFAEELQKGLVQNPAHDSLQVPFASSADGPVWEAC